MLVLTMLFVSGISVSADTSKVFDGEATAADNNETIPQDVIDYAVETFGASVEGLSEVYQVPTESIKLNKPFRLPNEDSVYAFPVKMNDAITTCYLVWQEENGYTHGTVDYFADDLQNAVESKSDNITMTFDEDGKALFSEDSKARKRSLVSDDVTMINTVAISEEIEYDIVDQTSSAIGPKAIIHPWKFLPIDISLSQEGPWCNAYAAACILRSRGYSYVTPAQIAAHGNHGSNQAVSNATLNSFARNYGIYPVYYSGALTNYTVKTQISANYYIKAEGRRWVSSDVEARHAIAIYGYTEADYWYYNSQIGGITSVSIYADQFPGKGVKLYFWDGGQIYW